MTLVIPQHYGEAILSFLWAGDSQPMAMTVGVHAPTATNTDANDVANEVYAAFLTNLIPIVSTVLTLEEVVVHLQADALPAGPVVGLAIGPDTGANSGNVLPQNSAYLVHKRTAVGGRGGRGRMYLPGCAEGSVSDTGVVASGTLTTFNTAWAGFLSDVTSGLFITELVVLHDSSGGTAGDPPAVITSLTMDSVIATQRRRLRR